MSDNAQQRAPLRAWWSRITRHASPPHASPSPSVFGAPLDRVLSLARVAISAPIDHDRVYVFGYVPVVVAKCGLFLKDNATAVQGIFRLAGHEKRIADLIAIFNSPPSYGRHLDWDGYTVHDAGSVLRRFFKQLPESLVPPVHQPAFLDALPPPDASQEAIDAAVDTYRHLISRFHTPNQHLFLYMLDLLALFHRNSHLNRMTASNIAKVFQPSIFERPLANNSINPEFAVSPTVPEHLAHLQNPDIAALDPTSPLAQTQMEVEFGNRAALVLEFLILHADAFPQSFETPPNDIQQYPLGAIPRDQMHQQQQSQPLPPHRLSNSPPHHPLDDSVVVVDDDWVVADNTHSAVAQNGSSAIRRRSSDGGAYLHQHRERRRLRRRHPDNNNNNSNNMNLSTPHFFKRDLTPSNNTTSSSSASNTSGTSVRRSRTLPSSRDHSPQTNLPSGQPSTAVAF